VVGMEMPKFSTGLTNYYMAKVSKEADSNKVICSPIDAFDFDKPIKLIKIDVEGHELSALRGMKSILERYHPILIVEGDNVEVNLFLASLGYAEERLEKSPNIIFKV
jgi:FkbM family methyltransferase